MAESILTNYREVGTKTSEKCSDDNLRIVGGKGGDIVLKKGNSAFIELVDYQTELIWYCGDSDERSACGSDFCAVNISKDSSGRNFVIHFYAKNYLLAPKFERPAYQEPDR